MQVVLLLIGCFRVLDSTPTPIPQPDPTPTPTCNPTEVQFITTSSLVNSLPNRNVTTEDTDITIDAVAYSLPVENAQSGKDFILQKYQSLFQVQMKI